MKKLITLVFIITGLVTLKSQNVIFEENTEENENTEVNIALSSNGASVTASSSYSGYDAYAAINDVIAAGKGWLSATTVQPQWLEVKFDDTYTIDSIVCDFSGSENQEQTYQLEYWDGSSWILITEVEPSTEVSVSHVFSAVTTEKIRFYVTNGKPNGYAFLSEIEVYEVVITLDLNESSETNASFSFYPNPATSIIYTEVGPIEILDLTGNTVINTESTGTIDVSSLKSGIYFITQNNKRTKLIIE